MTHFYYRDLNRRAKALEAKVFAEPEPDTICWIDAEDGLPHSVFFIGRGFWERQPGVPIPPEILRFARPEARAAYEARAAQVSAPRDPPEP
jgi:hypothetical protein